MDDGLRRHQGGRVTCIVPDTTGLRQLVTRQRGVVAELGRDQVDEKRRSLDLQNVQYI